MTSHDGPVVAGVAADEPAVVRYALREAARLSTRVRIMHCVAEDADDVHPDPQRTMRVAGSKVLHQARLVVEAHGRDADAEYVLEHGDPAAVLLGEAEDAQAIVVGADSSWVERMRGRNVSGQLVLGAACPVVVVPQGLPGEGPVDGVTVILDGGTASAGALQHGFEQADSRGEDLHVLYAVPAATTEADTASLTAKIARDVGQWNLLVPGVHVKLSLTTGGAVHECIEATARASLLVIGRPHGHAYSFALSQPVAMLVLREARCPVAIVPAVYRSSAAPPTDVAV